MFEMIRVERETKIGFLHTIGGILPNTGNLKLCLTCGACASGCPAAGLENMDPRKFVRSIAFGLDEDITEHPWVWMCTMCNRCLYACPMKINIPAMVFEARKLWPRKKRPRGILGSCDMALRNASASAMGTSSEDFQFVVEDVLQEVRDNQPGWESLQAPIDKRNAHIFLSQNSREPVTEPEEMVPLWKILYTVGADWTYGREGWGGENYCMFLADDENWKRIAHQTLQKAHDLGCKVYLNTECGHSTFSVWMGQKKFAIDTELEIAPMVKYYAQWIREGKLKVNSDWNRKRQIKFTVQDPCNQVRKSFGDFLAEELRFVLRAVVGDENFIDTSPNRSNNYCYGENDGSLQSGYKEARFHYGRLKHEQIMATGASYVVTPCHNCHAQIHELSGHFNGGYRTLHLWSIIGLSLGLLAQNERAYFGPDLADVNLPSKP